MRDWQSTIQCDIYLVRLGRHVVAMLRVLGLSCSWPVIVGCGAPCHMPAYICTSRSFQEGLVARQRILISRLVRFCIREMYSMRLSSSTLDSHWSVSSAILSGITS